MVRSSVQVAGTGRDQGPAGLDQVGLISIEELHALGTLFMPQSARGVAKRRFGARHDGGYVMLDAVREAGAVLSLGIGGDVSWDLAIAAEGLVVHQFDHTVEGPPLAHPSFCFHRKRVTGSPARGAVTLGEALVLLRQECGGAEPPASGESDRARSDEKQAGDAHRGTDAILKIDIEGAEWDVFDAATPDVLDGFAQIVCEFHGFDQAQDGAWYARARRVAEKLAAQFAVVHVHGNNFSPMLDWGGFGMPSVLEVTYAHRGRFTVEPTRENLPALLDFPNQQYQADHWLGRFDFGTRPPPPPVQGADGWLPHWLRLRPPAAGAAMADLSDAQVDWSATIGEAARNFSLPMLATLLEEAGLLARVPADVATFLSYALRKNAEDNTVIRVQCLDIGGALARAGTTGVLLKGAAFLFEPPPALHDRMMRDIDVLVPFDALEAAYGALADAGYRPSVCIGAEDGLFHGWPLEHGERPATIEVHVALSTRPDWLPAEEVFAAAIPVAPGLAVPAVRHRILHNAIHAQMINGDLAGGVINLRDAMDIGRLAVGNAGELDWPAIAAEADVRGAGPILSAALHKAAFATGWTVPEPFRSDRMALRHMRRCLLQRRWRLADRVLRPLGFLSRALAWERDAYPLGLGDRDDLGARLSVNRRRLSRAWKRLARIARP